MAIEARQAERNLVAGFDPVEFLGEQVSIDDLCCPVLMTPFEGEEDDEAVYSIVDGRFYDILSVDSEHFLYVHNEGNPYDDEELEGIRDEWVYQGVNVTNRQPDHRSFYIRAPRVIDLAARVRDVVARLQRDELFREDVELAGAVTQRHWSHLAHIDDESEREIIERVKGLYRDDLETIDEESQAAKIRRFKRETPEFSEMPIRAEVLPMDVLGRLHRVIRQLPPDDHIREIFERRLDNESIGERFDIPDRLPEGMAPQPAYAPDRPIAPQCPELEGPLMGEVDAPLEAVEVRPEEERHVGVRQVVELPVREHVVVRVIKEVAKSVFNTVVYVLSPFVFLANLAVTWSVERSYDNMRAVMNRVLWA